MSRGPNNAAAAGRPRDAGVDRAIIEAVELLVAQSGRDRITVASIVERAGTSKSAFYRRYRDVEQVLSELFDRRLDRIPALDTGSLPTDLDAVRLELIRLLQESSGEAILIDRAHNWTGRALRAAILRAGDRGELGAATDWEWARDALAGPILLRMLKGDADPTSVSRLERKIVLAALGVSGNDPTG